MGLDPLQQSIFSFSQGTVGAIKVNFALFVVTDTSDKHKVVLSKGRVLESILPISHVLGLDFMRKTNKLLTSTSRRNYSKKLVALRIQSKKNKPKKPQTRKTHHKNTQKP